MGLMIGLWLVVALIVNTMYRSNLKAMLIKPLQRLPFNNLEELIENNIPCSIYGGASLDTTIKVRTEFRVRVVPFPSNHRIFLYRRTSCFHISRNLYNKFLIYWCFFFINIQSLSSKKKKKGIYDSLAQWLT